MPEASAPADPVREHALVRCGESHWQNQEGTLAMRLGPLRAYLNLRCSVADPEVAAKIAEVLNWSLPTMPNTLVGARDAGALWLGPNEWLVLGSEDTRVELASSLERVLEGRHSAVTDVSGGQCAIEVLGPRAGDLLAKGCGIDLHPRVFTPGCCVQTVVAKASATICRWDQEGGFEILVRRSFAEYLWNWLCTAAELSFPNSN